MDADIRATHYAGLPAMSLKGAGGDSATVLLRGAQVMSWLNTAGDELLYQSPVQLQPGQPIRGGIPVVFPQFGNMGPLQKHGFARVCDWQLVDEHITDGHPSVTLRLVNAPWPHAFQMDLQVTLEPANTLHMVLTVRNCGDTPFAFRAALHPYFRVSDMDAAQIALVENGVLSREPIVPQDRICHDARGDYVLETPTGNITMSKTGFTDVVIWNPGPDHGIADLPAADYRKFVCIEPAAVKHPVELQPGAHWHATQTLRWQPA